MLGLLSVTLFGWCLSGIPDRMFHEGAENTEFVFSIAKLRTIQIDTILRFL